MGFSIAGRPIGPDAPPFVIAEMSGNHNQSLERALQIVDAAAASGAHALKIQTYTADSMTLDIAQGEFAISDPTSLWNGRTLYELYQEAATPYDWHRPIFERCREKGLVCFSTPFDAAAVDFLESLGAPAYKIASFENVDLPLIAKAASTGKPLIVSTGMASVAEIDEAVRAARDAGCRDLVLLKCTSTYPATPQNTNITTIPHMRSLFGCEVGLSDHTMGTGVAVAAVALGATVVEKHFTLARADGGVDSTFSLEPAEMAALVTETRRAWEALGQVSYGPTAAEQKSLQFRRSLYVVADLPAGTRLSAENVRAIRPGSGLPPKFLGQVIGRAVARAVKRGTPVTWDLFA
ncbi:pseudaminic acid synthase [Ramlibacter solisilvae]|uniref:N-acetylneuraminate synthase n=1 Tax=Ramlibacter tataouinensis TaxID=94132 RepID=A0A127JPY2_9BURK|nr:pseudaminic acid synthase [Ramlibacter tataouinensis]AMO22088.1 N-acetylneuraminate synthase [Ramlibacter tataouinensis]